MVDLLSALKFTVIPEPEPALIILDVVPGTVTIEEDNDDDVLLAVIVVAEVDAGDPVSCLFDQRCCALSCFCDREGIER